MMASNYEYGRAPSYRADLHAGQILAPRSTISRFFTSADGSRRSTRDRALALFQCFSKLDRTASKIAKE